MTIQESWFAFLVEIEFAKHHKMIDVDALSLAPTPFLDELLPSLLYIKLGCLVDEFFEQKIINDGLIVPSKYRSDFNGRITFLDDQGLLKDASKIHKMRSKRNEVAHELNKICTWNEFDNATNDVEFELQHLGLIGPPPKFEFYAERTPRVKADPGCIVSFDYCYGLKADGVKRVEVSWQQNLKTPMGQED